MFGFDVLENKSDLLIILLIIYFGSVMFSFVIKWIYPVLKEYAAVNIITKKVESFEDFSQICNNKHKNSFKKTAKKEPIFKRRNSDNFIENFDSLIDELKLLVEISRISSEGSIKSYINNNFLNNITIGIEKAVNIRRVLGSKLQGKMCSSETQTNITIDPLVKEDLSCAKVVLSHLPSVIPIQSSISSDQFESASSGSSDLEYSDCEYFPLVHNMGCCDLLQEKTTNQNVASRIEQKINSCIKTQNSPIKSNLVSSYGGDYSKQVSKENRILEMAITEFERELKPIRDQIKVLKECLVGVDHCDAQYSLPSGFTSSVTSTERQSEIFSTTISTTGDTNMLGCESSQCTNLGKNCGSLEKPAKCFKRSMVKMPLAPSRDYNKFLLNENFSNALENKLVSDIKIPLQLRNFKKRSPLAEMYIKLSQTNSQSTSFLKKKKSEVVLQSIDSNTVTCHINLNLHLGTVSTANVCKTNWIKDREMLPILSQPEDLLGEPSNTHISLKPALKS